MSNEQIQEVVAVAVALVLGTVFLSMSFWPELAWKTATPEVIKQRVKSFRIIGVSAILGALIWPIIFHWSSILYSSHTRDLIWAALMLPAGIAALYISFRPGLIWKTETPEVIKRRARTFRILSLISIICTIVSLVLFNWGALRAELAVRQINRQFAAMLPEIKNLPPGEQRTAEIIRRLSVMDVANAPAEVKQAINECLNSLNLLAQAYQAHQDSAILEQTCRKNFEALSTIVQKYQ